MRVCAAVGVCGWQPVSGTALTPPGPSGILVRRANAAIQAWARGGGGPMGRSMRRRYLPLFVLCAARAPPGAALAEPITVGATNSTSDAPIFIADRKGFFRDEGIDV